MRQPSLNRVGNTANVVPFHLSFNIFDFPELVTQFHHRETNHTGIETKGSPDSHLDWPRGVKAHDKVLAVCIPGLVLRGGLGQSEGAPVGVAADYAAGPEDLDTRITGDSSIY